MCSGQVRATMTPGGGFAKGEVLGRGGGRYLAGSGLEHLGLRAGAGEGQDFERFIEKNERTLLGAGRPMDLGLEIPQVAAAVWLLSWCAKSMSNRLVDEMRLDLVNECQGRVTGSEQIFCQCGRV